MRNLCGVWTAATEKLALIIKTWTTKVKPLPCCDYGCWSAGTEELYVIKTRAASLKWSLLGYMSSRSAHRNCVPGAAKVDSRRVTHVMLGLKAWECCREQLRCGTVWQSRRLPRRGYWWKWSPVAVENPNMLEISHHGMNAKGSSRCRMELAWSKEINLCVQNLRAEQNSDPSPLEEPRLLVDPRHCTQVVCLFVFSLSWVWFCFVQMVTMIWFFLEVRKYLTFFFYL